MDYGNARISIRRLRRRAQRSRRAPAGSGTPTNEERKYLISLIFFVYTDGRIVQKIE
jgi:hypothetical protein